MFWHDLTALIGGCTVAELQERMTADEFAEWLAWSKIRGVFGEQRADLRNGILCALLVNVATAMAGKRGKAKPSDYMPFLEKVNPQPDRQRAVIEQVRMLEGLLGVQEG